MKTIRVRAKSGSYPVIFGRGTLARLGELIRPVSGKGEVYVLSSPRVWRYWGREVMRGLAHSTSSLRLRSGRAGSSSRRAGERVILFDDRETAKRLANVEMICRKLLHKRADRNALIVAVGGGVVGDVAGFVAASYLRGVKIVHVPTTVVAQMDSAIGGKTGVDLPEGKNLVGAFYPPQMVVADPSVLRTLSPRQFRSGIYEIIKCGVIGDSKLFKFLESEIGAVLRRDEGTLDWAMERSARVKINVVSRDEREGGPRQILNFGHTMGHAIETATEYKGFLHGEAVAWGMIGAAMIGVGLGRLREHDASRIAFLVARCGGLPKLPDISPAALLRIIARDKKSRGGRVGWVIPQRIGRADIGVEAPDWLVAATWRELPEFFARARDEIRGGGG
ncbi:MAG TPA: 3-dehydroquinate synthase [Candidatus Acidoferrales bacterium]|nr:3-dehydroquinate synthase [Candidatus Acidoferrales bacterium]